jgi:hypothetical protein
MKGSLSLLFLALAAVSADKLGIPKKSWAVIGYESFNGKVKNAKTAAKVPPPPPPKTVPVKKDQPEKQVVKKPTAPPAPKPDQKNKKAVAAEGPSSTAKAVIGAGAALAVAAFSGSILGSQPKPQRALVEAVKKPVVVVTPPNASHMSNPDGASIPNEVFNLVKAIVGVGVLSLPAGVAAFGTAPSAFIPAGILIAVIGILSGYGFALIGRVCAYTGAKSYREAWSRTVGESTSWIPAWSTTCKTFLACLAFSMVLADTFSSLLDTGRNETLLAVTLLILTPLCLMKNLKSLAPFSLLGVLGMAYTALAMTVRYLDGSYLINGEEQGAFVSQVARHLKPKFGNLGVASVFSPNALILVCMLSTAYMVRPGFVVVLQTIYGMISTSHCALLLFSLFPGPLQCPEVLP